MGFTYVHIDSSRRQPHESDSSINVQLSEPIQRARSVRMVSCSVPNEFFNVTLDNREMEFLIYPYDGGVVQPGDAGMVSINIALDVGLYKIPDLIPKINDALAAYTDAERLNVEMSFEWDPTTQRVLFEATPAVSGTPARLVVMVHPKDHTFFNSVPYRLGFGRFQVCPYDRNVLATDVRDGQTFTRNFKGQLVLLDLQEFFVLNTDQITQVSANYIGFETHPFLFIRSDELVRHSLENWQNLDGSTTSKRNSVLAKIPINVNMYSWVHFTGAEYTFAHRLDGRTIHNFDLTLTNHIGGVFTAGQFKDWQCTLEFETVDNAEQVNVAAISALSNKAYNMRHCT